MAFVNHEAVWISNNRLWEIRLDRNDLYIINNKTGSRYTVEINKNGSHYLWSTSIKDGEKVPAYVTSRIERVYQELHKVGDIM